MVTLASLRRLHAAATPGPLVYEGYDPEMGHHTVGIGADWLGDFGRQEDARFVMACIDYVRDVLAETCERR